MNIYRKSYLEVIAESAGKHIDAEHPKTLSQLTETDSEDSASPAPDRACKQPVTAPKRKRKSIDEYLKILEKINV